MKSSLPPSRTIQKAILSTTSRTRERSSIVQTSAMGIAAPAPEAVAAPSHLSPSSPVAAAMTRASSQLLAASSAAPGGASSSSSSSSCPSSASDPLAILRCDAGHARHVTHLHLSRRGISVLHRNVLLFVNLEELWLNDNDITELRGVAPPPALHHLAVPCGCLRLKRLFLSRNRIASFAGSDLQRLRHLQVLLAANNRLSGLEAVSQQLAVLVGLKQLDLSGNPLAEERNYRSYIIAHHPSLEVLDNHAISRAERDRALQLFPPVQVSKSRSTANVAFGSTMKLTLQQQQQQQQAGAGEAPRSSGASAVSYASSSAIGSTTTSSSSSKKKNPFLSEMAKVLEVRAKAVKNKRSALKAKAEAQEEHEFQECAAQHTDFHRQWEEMAKQQIITAVAQQQKEQLDVAAMAASQKGGGAASKAAQQQQLQLQQQTPEQLAAAQLAGVVPVGSLPPLKRGVVANMFDSKRKMQLQQHQQGSSNNANKKLSLDELLYMERDSDVFAKCLDERTVAGGSAALGEEGAVDAATLRRFESATKMESVALEEIEAKSLKAAFSASTLHNIRDLSFKVCDIVGMAPSKHLEPLIQHYYADSKARHGRLDGQHVVRALMEYRPFLEERVEQLYQRSNAAVRTKPEEATAQLRRISALNDFLELQKSAFETRRSIVGSAIVGATTRK